MKLEHAKDKAKIPEDSKEEMIFTKEQYCHWLPNSYQQPRVPEDIEERLQHSEGKIVGTENSVPH